MVEQRTENPRVTGSIPVLGIFLCIILEDNAYRCSLSATMLTATNTLVAYEASADYSGINGIMHWSIGKKATEDNLMDGKDVVYAEKIAFRQDK